MAQIIDTLVTEYRMNSKQYEEGAKRVVSSTQGISAVIGRATSGIGGLVTKAVASVGGIGGAISLGFAAKTAIEFDTIQRSLTALTGSAERAKQILSFTDKLAAPSIFSSQELASGAKLLEALGLQTEKYLPVAEKLGTIFGANEEALMSYITALGYLKGERFGEGFESLSRAGISRTMLKGKGLEFDKGGQFLGSAEQALNAVEQLVTEKFGKLSQEMASGPQAKLASVMDAITRGARVAGAAILSVLVPAAEKVGNFIAYLVDSGRVEKAFKGIASMFGQGDIGSVLIKGLAIVTAAIGNIPKMLQKVQQGLKWVGEQAGVVAVVLGAVFLSGSIVRGVMAIVAAFQAVRVAIAASTITAVILQGVLTGAAGIAKAVGGIVAGAAAGFAAYKMIESALPKGQGIGDILLGIPGFDQIGKDAGNIMKGFQGGIGTQMTDAAIAAIKAQEDQKNKALDPANQTAKNTAKLVELQEKSIDFQTALIGGGQVGQQAFSGLQVANATGGGSATSRQLVKAIDDHIAQITGKRSVVVGRTYGYNR
jgi:hypothetical protein